VTALRLPGAVAAWAELAATLVNTRPRPTDPPEKLASPADLERLLAACPEPPPPDRDLAGVRALREPLLRAFEADDVPSFADAVNPLLGRSAVTWQMIGGALVPAGGERLADWLGARAARGLAELVIGYGVERLHVCWADDCGKAVADLSRNGTRRYCSRRCANRTNMRRHRATR
jgi:predicted RNA-binding Zn ribbon-like protein